MIKLDWAKFENVSYFLCAFVVWHLLGKEKRSSHLSTHLPGSNRIVEIRRNFVLAFVETAPHGQTTIKCYTTILPVDNIFIFD